MSLTRTVVLPPAVTNSVGLQPNISTNSSWVKSPGTVLHRESQTVVFNNCDSGLGIKIIGGLSEDDDDDRDFGIFVRKVLPGGLAEKDGRLREADQLLEVNGDGLEEVTNDRAVTLLRQASAFGYVKLVVCRDAHARDDYLELLNSYSYSTSSSAASSRATTPSIHESDGWAGREADNANVDSSSGSSTPKQGSPALERRKTAQMATVSPTSVVNNWLPTVDPNLRSPRQSPTGHLDASHTSPRHLQRHSVDSTPVTVSSAPVESFTVPANSHFKAGVMTPAMSSTPQDADLYSSYHLSLPRKYTIHRKAVLKNQPPTSANRTSPAGYYSTEPSPVMTNESPDHRQSPFHGVPAAHGSLHSPPAPQTQQQKMALDPTVRLKVEKLQTALHYLGVQPSLEQQSELRTRLPVDDEGMVLYGDFVRVSRQLFRMQLEDRSVSPMPFTTSDIHSFLQPPAFKPMDISGSTELERVKAERDELRREVERLKGKLRDKDRTCNAAEDELLRIRREAQGALHESRSLRSKVELAEQAQHAARSMEHDYVEVVRALEHEVAVLKDQQLNQMESPAVQKRLALLGCQLRKAENGKKTYEVATEKLLQFAEVVHSGLTGHGDGSLSRPGSGNPSRAGSASSKLTRQTVQSLANGARETVQAVKTLIEVEPLPFGWEEAYTSSGMKYYTNHVTQLTIWEHPVTRIQHNPAMTPRNKPSGRSRDSNQRNTPTSAT